MWVFERCGSTVNEKADKLAKTATSGPYEMNKIPVTPRKVGDALYNVYKCKWS